MARKRKNLKDLSYTSPEYWDKLLIQEGLSVESGRSKRVIYVGGSQILDDLAGQEAMGTRDRSKDPKKNSASTDEDEQ